MSYDVYVQFPKCDHCGVQRDSIGIGNYTSNVGPMWRAVQDNGLMHVQDMSCPDAAKVIESMIAGMVDRRDELTAMNPPNGWGNYDGALNYLRKILEACNENLTGTIYVSA